MPSPRSTPSPICAPASRSAATFSSGRQRAERVGVGAQRLEERRVERAVALVELERRRQRDAFGRDAGERPGPAAGAADAFCRAISSSTSFSVMKPRFSIVDEVDAVQLGELDGLPRRLAVARRPASAPASPRAFASIAASSSAVSATYAIVLPSSTSTSSP